jgi:AcrR family transcriptional regulator
LAVVATTKDRILDTTAELFRRYGYTGTGLKQIVAAANAPFGSVYHHFPGGKEQLGGEVIRRSGAMYGALFAAILDETPDDVVAGIRNFFLGAAETLRQTDYADACPIATVALEVASANEPLREATADVFEGWIAGGAARLAAAGIEPQKARELTIGFLAALEGAFVLCRALRSTEALEVTGEAAAQAVAAALPG